MSSKLTSKGPGPQAYDHLWSLLPVFATFFAVIVFAVAADDRLQQHAVEAPAMPVYEPGLFGPTDISVPSAANAMAGLPDVAAEPVATF